jgi:hypothetical protein
MGNCINRTSAPLPGTSPRPGSSQQNQPAESEVGLPRSRLVARADQAPPPGLTRRNTPPRPQAVATVVTPPQLDGSPEVKQEPSSLSGAPTSSPVVYRSPTLPRVFSVETLAARSDQAPTMPVRQNSLPSPPADAFVATPRVLFEISVSDHSDVSSLSTVSGLAHTLLVRQNSQPRPPTQPPTMPVRQNSR